MAFYKVSAKKNTNIKQAYQTLIQGAYQNVKKQLKNQKESIFIDKLKAQSSKVKGKGGCC